MAGLVDEKGKILARKRKDYVLPYSREELSDDLVKLAYSLPLEGVSAGGITVPGTADPEKGIWLDASFSKITDWKIGDECEKEFGIPFYAENDVNACAMAEHRFGLCRNISDYMWITLSNGVGGAIFTDNKLYSGENFGAGEIGHIVVEENGKRCACGNRGCLETVASGRGISSYYQSLTGEIKSAKAIAELARAGDKAAFKTYERVGRGLGKAISCAVNLLNIETFILGGGVSADMELFVHTAYAEMEKRLFTSANPDIRIKYTALGYNAALLGCAAVAQQGEEEHGFIQ